MFVGLLMEKLWEKKSYKNTHDFKLSKRIREVGAWLVIAGIVFEIGVAVWTASDAWETRQMTIKNDPLNQPIKSMDLEVNLNIFDPNRPEDDENEVAILGGYCKFLKKQGGDIAVLECREFDNTMRLMFVANAQGTTQVSNVWIYNMGFKWPGNKVSAMLSSEIGQGNISTKMFNSQIAGVNFFIPRSGTPLRILEGSCVLTINGSIQRTFLIPKHLNEMFLINTNQP